MRRLLAILCLLCCTFLAAAPENLLRNPAFEGPDGKLPASWNAGNAAAVRRIALPAGSPAPYGLEITNANSDKKAFVIQNGLPLAVGEFYTLTIRFKGTPKTVIDIYAECSNPWKTMMSPRMTCDGTWQTVSLALSFPVLNARPYVVFRAVTGGTVCFTAPVLAIDDTRLRNGDFTGGTLRWQLDHASVIKLDETHGNVLELQNLQGPAAARQNGIQIKAGQLYKLTYQASGGTDKAYTDVQGATWFRIAPFLNGAPVPGTATWKDSFPNWQTKKLTFKLDQDAVIDVVAELKSPGTVRFDNITLAPCKSELPLLDIALDMPFGHGNAAFLPDHQDLAQLTGILVTELAPASYRLDFNGTVTTITPKAAQGGCPFALPLPKKPGQYPLRATALDAAGTPLATAELAFAVHPPTTQRKITFRDDRVMLIDGKPFFPLGTWDIYGKLPYAERLKRIAACGFNCKLASQNALDLHAEAGLFPFVQVGATIPQFKQPAAAEAWHKRFRQTIADLAANPNVLGYFTIDEPAWNGKPYQPLQDFYKLLRQLDPYRPVFLNEAPRGEIDDLRHYAAAADLYGVDIYPIPSPNSHSDLVDKTMTSVGKYTDICDEVVRSRKPVWMTLQAFSWNAIRKRDNPIYPTADESRFMAYDAIVHGATGLFYWGFNCGGLENWDFVTLLGQTIHELDNASGLLTARNVKPAELKAAPAAINWLHKRVGSHDYIIAVNDSPTAVTATFNAPRFNGTVHVLTEKRTVTAAGNTFSDTFPPYGVHLYATSPDFPPPCEKPAIVPPTAKPSQFTDDFRHASWIWYPKTNKNAKDQAFFIRDFTLPANTAKAELFITADDQFQAFLNGKIALEHAEVNGRGHANVSVLDITKALTAGTNRLAVHAVDAGQPPCALLFAIRFTDKDGKLLQRLVSDGQTLTAKPETAPADWRTNAFQPAGWLPAEVLFPYGQGPWADQAIPLPADLRDLGKYPFP